MTEDRGKIKPLSGDSAAPIRKFESGATRDQSDDKYDLEGFENPLVTKRFCEYMHKHRHQADGKLRDSDNWQKGIPKKEYLRSLCRHVLDLRLHMRGYSEEAVEELEDSLCAIIFNAQGLLLELLKERKE
jgi:hypothetical protein